MVEEEAGVWAGSFAVGEVVTTVDVVTVHHDAVNGLPAHVSGPYLRVGE